MGETVSVKKRFEFKIPKLTMKRGMIVLLGLGILLALGWYINSYLRRNFAAAAQLSVMLAPSKAEVVPSEKFQISMQYAGGAVSAIELFLEYDATKVIYAKDNGAESGITGEEDSSFFAPLIEETIDSTSPDKKILHVLLISHEGQNAFVAGLSFQAKEVGDAQFQLLTEGVKWSRFAGISVYQTPTYFEFPVPVTTSVLIQDAAPSASPTLTSPPDAPTATPTSTVIPSATATAAPSEIPPTATASPTAIPTATATVIPNVTATPTTNSNSSSLADVSMQTKLRFQGITAQPASEYQTLQVKVTLESTSSTFSKEVIAPFVAGSDGVWSATINMSQIPIQERFIMYVKGPKHLRKKICENSPREQTGGNYRCKTGGIALVPGTNTIDFSGILMFAGDIPIQNGVVDARDIVLIRNNFGSVDPQLLLQGDLNLDGIIHSQDLVLVYKALEFKYDEE